MLRRKLSDAVREIESSLEAAAIMRAEAERLEREAKRLEEETILAAQESLGARRANELVQMAREGIAEGEHEPHPAATALAIDVISGGIAGLRRELAVQGHIEIDAVPEALQAAPSPDPAPALPPPAPAAKAPRPPKAPAAAKPVPRPPEKAVRPSAEKSKAAPAPPLTMLGVEIPAVDGPKAAAVMEQAASDAQAGIVADRVSRWVGRNQWQRHLYLAAHASRTAEIAQAVGPAQAPPAPGGAPSGGPFPNDRAAPAPAVVLDDPAADAPAAPDASPEAAAPHPPAPAGVPGAPRSDDDPAPEEPETDPHEPDRPSFLPLEDPTPVRAVQTGGSPGEAGPSAAPPLPEARSQPRPAPPAFSLSPLSSDRVARPGPAGSERPPQAASPPATRQDGRPLPKRPAILDRGADPPVDGRPKAWDDPFGRNADKPRTAERPPELSGIRPNLGLHLPVPPGFTESLPPGGEASTRHVPASGIIRRGSS